MRTVMTHDDGTCVIEVTVSQAEGTMPHPTGGIDDALVTDRLRALVAARQLRAAAAAMAWATGLRERVDAEIGDEGMVL